MIKLRPYQEEAIAGIRSAFASGKKRVLLQAPTGSGKTVMFTAMVKAATDRGKTALIVTDRVELLKQAGGSLFRFGLIADTIAAHTRHIRPHHLYVGMLETISRRAKNRAYQHLLKNIDLVILDEAHKNSFNKLFPLFNPRSYVIGATATPIRFGSQPSLSSFYDSMVETISIPELIRQGYLSPARTFGINVDLKGVRVRGGEFRSEDLSEVYQNPKLYSGVVKNWFKHTPKTKTLVFSASVENSKAVCQEYNENGIEAVHLDATVSKNERSFILDRFKHGDFPVLCNVGILTTGFDDPSIETIVLYRATKSLPLFLQMCGRGSRIYPGKSEFAILDFGNNISRHGFWESDREWSLEHDVKKKTPKENSVNVKYCPGCDALLSFNVRLCPHCGHDFNPRYNETEEADLIELRYSDIEMIAESLTVKELERVRKHRGYKIGWVLHRIKTRGIEAWREYAELKGYDPRWVSINYKRYCRV